LIKLRISCDLAEISVRIGIVFLFIINSFDVQAKKTPSYTFVHYNINQNKWFVNSNLYFFDWMGKAFPSLALRCSLPLLAGPAGPATPRYLFAKQS
jgi:hypothetical protein